MENKCLLIGDSLDSETTTISYHNGRTLFSAVANKQSVSALEVVKEPEGNDRLREVSDVIDVSDSVRTYLEEFLLPTMYEEGGIGIASIQVGIPIRALIVDIPVVKSVNGVPYSELNPRYVRNAVQAGRTVRVKESRPVFLGGRSVTEVVEKTFESAPGKEEDGEEEVVCVERNPVFILNPHITWLSEERVVIDEGCLSVPYSFVEDAFGGRTAVERPSGIAISYTDLQGTAQAMRAEGEQDEHQKLLARALQHEYDHLNGILFIDKLYSAS
jgi:peptide deformylase